MVVNRDQYVPRLGNCSLFVRIFEQKFVHAIFTTLDESQGVCYLDVK